MCLAIPARVVEILDDHKALVDLQGNTREVSTFLVPGVKEGDYLLLHAGAGLEIIDEVEALETLRIISLLLESGDD